MCINSVNIDKLLCKKKCLRSIFTLKLMNSSKSVFGSKKIFFILNGNFIVYKKESEFLQQIHFYSSLKYRNENRFQMLEIASELLEKNILYMIMIVFNLEIKNLYIYIYICVCSHMLPYFCLYNESKNY